jgi:hypothetical protein
MLKSRTINKGIFGRITLIKVGFGNFAYILGWEYARRS